VNRASFWFVAILLGAFLFAASAPSPLYSIYQAQLGLRPITLTEIYAVYALGAVVALLVFGRISDFVGRKPAALAGIAIQLFALAVFIAATGVEWLFVARALQGFATGIAASALSAWLLDLEPADRPGLGSLVGGIAPLAGLGLGAIVTGVLADKAPDPLHLAFWLLAAFFALAIPMTATAPDVISRRPGALHALIPRIGVPQPARALFTITLPSLVAMWAIAGLYLALGGALAAAILHPGSHTAGGLVAGSLLATGAAVSYGTRRVEPIVAVRRGSVALIVGVACSLVAVAAGSFALLVLGAVVAGAGLGPGFSGFVRLVTPLAAQHERGMLVAAIFFVVYTAFSIPSVLAGAATGLFGLPETTFGYGLVVMLLAGATRVRLVRRTAAAPTF